jgi:hypothetical protein
MEKINRSDIRTAVIISLLLVLMGHIFVLQCTPVNEIPTLTIRDDAFFYIDMANGKWSAIPSPWKFRVLVPFLAGLLPFSAVDSLRLVAYLSLFFSYLFMFLACRKMGVSLGGSVIGLCCVWCSRWHLMNYNNPYLTDAFGLFILCVMMFSFLDDKFFVFLIAAVLGILARETTVFLVPVWLIRREWKRSLVLILAAVLAFISPRLLLGSGTDITIMEVFERIGMEKIRGMLSYGKDIFMSWTIVWFLSVLGLLFLPKNKYISASAIYSLLMVGAFATSLIAVDTGRMFSILTPVLAVTSAHFIDVLEKERMAWAKWVLVLLLTYQAIMYIPNLFFIEDSPENRWLRIAMAIIELLFTGCVVLILRKKIFERISEGFSSVKEFMRNLYRNRRTVSTAGEEQASR